MTVYLDNALNKFSATFGYPIGHNHNCINLNYNKGSGYRLIYYDNFSGGHTYLSLRLKAAEMTAFLNGLVAGKLYCDKGGDINAFTYL